MEKLDKPFEKLNSNLDVIVVYNPKHTIYEKNDDGTVGKRKECYASVEVRQDILSKSDIHHGDGQMNPHFLTRVKPTDDFGNRKSCLDHKIRIPADVMADIENASGDNKFSDSKGNIYMAVKCDAKGLFEVVKDVSGKPIMKENGKPETEMAGYTVKPGTVEKSSTAFDKDAYIKHLRNTDIIGHVHRNAARTDALLHNDKMPWNTGDGRLNIMVFDTLYDDEAGGFVHSQKVFLDVTNASDTVLKNNAREILDFETKGPGYTSKGDINFSPFAGIKVHKLLSTGDMPCYRENDRRMAYACSIELNDDGTLNWSSIGKSTIHPDKFSKSDCEPFKENYGKVMRAYYRRDIDASQETEKTSNLRKIVEKCSRAANMTRWVQDNVAKEDNQLE